MKKFLKEYRIEIIALLLTAVGIFLLIEQFQIRTSIWNALTNLGESFHRLTVGLRESLAGFLQVTTISDLIGYLVIFLSLGFFAWRVHYRFLRSRFWAIRNCPRCGSQVIRAQRSRWERLVSKIFFLHGRRYRCTNPECRWSGMRGPSHMYKKEQPAEKMDNSETPIL